MRYERKYKLDLATPAFVNQVIKLHPASFRKIHPDRQVNNIYFDTIDLTTYKDNVIGIADRKKFRVRWYGRDLQYAEFPNLEIKSKSNQLGDKKTFPVHSFALDDIKYLTAQVNNIIDPLNNVRPVLLNSYQRSYFGTFDGKFRMTVDWNLNYHSLLNASSFQKYQHKENGVVVELKYDESLDNATDRIMQYLPFRQTKSSKYVNGVSLVIG